MPAARNPQLLAHRKALRLSQSQLARRLGMPISRYNAFERMRVGPLTLSGQWSKMAQTLADGLGVPPGDLWPEEALELGSVPVHRLDVVTPELPDAELHRADIRRLIDVSLEALTLRQVQAIRLRFGLNGESEHSLTAVGDAMGISTEWARQLLRRGMRKLRHRQQSRWLWEWFEDEKE